MERTLAPISELNHKDFDEHWLSSYKHALPWCIASQQWNTPYKPQEFIQYVHDSFLKVFEERNDAGKRSLGKQDLSVDRAFFQHQWHWLLSEGAIEHTGIPTAVTLQQKMRESLSLVLNDKKNFRAGAFVITGKHHPLSSHPSKRPAESGDGMPIHIVESNSYDKKLAQWMLDQRIVDELLAKEPKLTQVDEHIRLIQYSYSFRKKIGKLLEDNALLSRDQRQDLVSAILDEWVTMTGGKGPEKMEEVEQILGVSDLTLMDTKEVLDHLKSLRNIPNIDAKILERACVEAVTIAHSVNVAKNEKRTLELTAAACREYLEHYGLSWNECPSLGLAHTALFIRYCNEEQIKNHMALQKEHS